jgi:hypothetical protein
MLGTGSVMTFWRFDTDAVAGRFSEDKARLWLSVEVVLCSGGTDEDFLSSILN